MFQVRRRNFFFFFFFLRKIQPESLPERHVLKYELERE